ncbi:MAG TPA: hypothetical protein VFZ61_27885 [Polyangiales bacterium]
MSMHEKGMHEEGTHEKGDPALMLSEDERSFRASLEGLVDFYRVSQGGALWRAFWPGTFVFAPLGSLLMAVALTDRFVFGRFQLALVVTAILITALAPLWAIVTLLRSIRRDDRYVAIFKDGVRVCLDPGEGPERYSWAELLDAQCEGERLRLSTARGELVIQARFAELSLTELAFRIRDAKRLALWGRLSRPSLLRTQP